MIDVLRAAFPQIAIRNCLELIFDDTICIYDTDAGRCIIQVDTEGEKHFTVFNPSKRQIHFVAIDKCLLMDSDDLERCDCAVFDEKTFCFIEIKVKEPSARRKAANRKAKDQLKATILLFRSNVTFTTKRIEAYVCVGTTVSRPARRATDLDELFEFEEELGVALYHGNEKRFA